ncbi:pyrroline-5-carboxylate reductase dimerization domain-containing protein [Rhodococcus triatomae]|nr:pyrroline-5-carboxylate reductase dimerization domain-containing protein [Rhodococcus triatomae]
MQDSDEDAATLRVKVCAPGGTGIRRIAELDARAVRAALVVALTRST